MADRRPLSREAVREKVLPMLLELLRLRGVREGRKVEAWELLPIDPRIIATDVLGINYIEVPEIGEASRDGSRQASVAGLFERDRRTITIAGNLPPGVRRFTGAHEIGHFALHPTVASLRESPSTGADVRKAFRTFEEVEADAFAAELLMPEKLVASIFRALFGDPIDGGHGSDDCVFYLTNGRMAASDFRRLGALQRAELVAESSSFTAADNRAPSEIFGVSTAAMAVRLCKLGLVA